MIAYAATAVVAALLAWLATRHFAKGKLRGERAPTRAAQRKHRALLVDLSNLHTRWDMNGTTGSRMAARDLAKVLRGAEANTEVIDFARFRRDLNDSRIAAQIEGRRS